MIERSARWRTMALVLLLALAASAQAGTRDGRLDIYWIDTEGGAATLIVTPAGESVLIDAGNPGTRDPGRIAQVATREAGLRRIDHLVITHYHGDHFGGAAMLSKLLPIGHVYDNGEFPGQPNFPDKEYLNFKCDARSVISPSDVLPLRKSAAEGALPVKLTCIAARQQFIEPPPGAPTNSAICATHKPKDRDGSDNANSVVLLLAYGPFRFFDAGDLTWNVEQKLVCPVNLVGKVDVYQVTHHGLDASNNPLVLQSLEPTVAVMNNGTEKGCMPGVFENLQSLKSLEAMYQVHKNLRPDGARFNTDDAYIANHTAECQGNFIKMSVAADGTNYTISIPAGGHERTYKTKTR